MERRNASCYPSWWFIHLWVYFFHIPVYIYRVGLRRPSGTPVPSSCQRYPPELLHAGIFQVTLSDYLTHNWILITHISWHISWPLTAITLINRINRTTVLLLLLWPHYIATISDKCPFLCKWLFIQMPGVYC